MNKKFIILALIIILTSTIIYFLISYLTKINERNKFLDVFPQTPKIPDVQSPKTITKLQFSNIFSPYISGRELIYFDNSGTLTSIDLYSYQARQIPQFKILPTHIYQIKPQNGDILLVSYIEEAPVMEYQGQGSDIIPAMPSTQILKTIILNLKYLQKQELPPEIIDAVWSEKGDKLITKEFAAGGTYTLNIRDINGSNKVLIHNFGAELISINENQRRIIDNYLYYYKGVAEKTLYRLNLTNFREQEIYKNVIQATISPNGKYAFINHFKNDNYESVIYNIEKRKIAFIFTFPVIIQNIVWDEKGENLYYLAGENLKIADESKHLNREASYVFFKYNTATNINEQLNNHNYSNPIDPVSLMLNETQGKIYVVSLDMSEYNLYYLNLK